MKAHRWSIMFSILLLGSVQFSNVGTSLRKPLLVVSVAGTWEYQDKNSISHPVGYARVEIWDYNSSTAHTLLGQTATDTNGNFQKVISSSESQPDIYVKVFSRDDYSAWVGSSANNISTAYSVTTETYMDYNNTTLNIGTRVIVDPNKKVAFYIYDLIANKAWNYLYGVGWDNNYNLAVQWYPNSSVGTYYTLGGAMYLIDGDKWDPDVILHEYSHFVMNKIYATYPPRPNCSPHSWSSPSSEGCAWTEGWATFLQGAIQNDRYYNDTDDQILNLDLEPPTPAASGANVEGAVTASLWDIFDSSAENWDKVSLAINGGNSDGIWSVVYDTDPNTAKEFETMWISSANGFNCGVIDIFSHHTIGNGKCVYLPLIGR